MRTSDYCATNTYHDANPLSWGIGGLIKAVTVKSAEVLLATHE